MVKDLKMIIHDYYTEVQKSFKTGKLDFSKLHFDENISVIGPNERFDGKKTVETMYSQLISIVTRFDIQRQYFDSDSCCTVMDCVTKSPPMPIATIEWILVRHGKIVEIHPVYDTKAWDLVMQAISK